MPAWTGIQDARNNWVAVFTVITKKDLFSAACKARASSVKSPGLNSFSLQYRPSSQKFPSERPFLQKKLPPFAQYSL